MKYSTGLFIVIAILSCCEIYAQSNDNLKKLQEISLDQIHQKKSKPKTSQRQNQQELSVNDSIFKLFDVDIDLTLGEISFDMSWRESRSKAPGLRIFAFERLHR